MSINKDSSRASRPGGRSARIRKDVMTATLQMLETRSVPDLSIRDVAAAAGVAETTIYRRWGSLPGLITAALAEFALAENPIPDTGNLKDDLTQLLYNVVALIERPSVRRIFRFTMALDDAESASARTEFWHTRFAAGAEIITRAVERGEIPAVSEPIEVIEVLVGAAYVRTFLLERTITEVTIAASVQSALQMIQRISSAESSLDVDAEDQTGT